MTVKNGVLPKHAGQRNVGIEKVGLFWIFAPNICGDEIIDEIPSPQGNQKVVVFQRDCGATTGFSTQASILEITQILKNESGNVFTSDTDHGAAPYGPRGGPTLAVAWRSKNSVRLSFHFKTRVFKRESKMGVIHVFYAFPESDAQQGASERAPKTAHSSALSLSVRFCQVRQAALGRLLTFARQATISDFVLFHR